MDPTCTLVLGTPRSGTSAVANVLRHLGVHMGDELPPVTHMHPEGACQDLELEAIVDACRASATSAHFLPYGTELELPEHDALLALIAKRRRAGKPWGLKSPSLPALLTYFVAHASPLRVILTRRPLGQSRLSWVRGMQRLWMDRAAEMRVDWDDEAWARHPMPKFKGDVIDQVNASIEQALAAHAPLFALPIDFEAMLADPKGAVEKIAGFVELPVTQAALDSIKPDFRHIYAD